MSETKKRNKGVIVNIGASGQFHADAIIKGIPKKLWDEWDASCKKDYQDIRWLKLWSDHLIAEGRIRDRDDLIAEVLNRVQFEIEQASENPPESEAVDDGDEVQVLSGRA